jgi:hypothetical protein
MKKFLLITTLMVSFAQQTIKAEDNINSLELVADSYNTSFIDLPLKSQAGAGALGLIVGAYTFLATRALTNIFQPKRRELDLFNVKTWTWAELMTTPLAAGFTTHWLAGESKPEVAAQRANENGLLDVILESETNEEILKNIDAKFIVERFPRATAFAQLTSLRNTLTSLLKITTQFNIYRPHDNFDLIKETLTQNINKVDLALLVVKQDARWLQECNAQTMNNMHSTQDAQFKSELANTAINIAHAYAKNK